MHVDIPNCQRKIAFTLAEVLITLGIIGVVAALTMPSLIANHREKEYTAKLKKFQSIMSQAVTKAVSEQGEIEDWGLSLSVSGVVTPDADLSASNASLNKFWDILAPQLKIIERCDYGSSCQGKVRWDRHSLDGTRFGYFTPNITLADGTTIVGTWISSPSCKIVYGSSIALQNVCGQFFVDLNGKKLPNQTGKDVFLFYFTKYGVLPQGTAEESHYNFNQYCNRKNSHHLNGYGCTAWVIYNENMDYLKCDDLNWDNKTSCK